MKKIIESEDLLTNSDFVLWFLMTNFPEGIHNENDQSLFEIVQENCTIDKDLIDNLTGYYEGVFDESDGYIDNPNVIKLELVTGDVFFVEFHPGDTLYYINNEELGCTGPDYVIRKISLAKFKEYTNGLKSIQKILLLPMIRISYMEKEELIEMINSIIDKENIQGCNIEDISMCILENCLE